LGESAPTPTEVAGSVEAVERAEAEGELAAEAEAVERAEAEAEEDDEY
jgi:hypothetical protein